MFALRSLQERLREGCPALLGKFLTARVLLSNRRTHGFVVDASNSSMDFKGSQRSQRRIKGRYATARSAYITSSVFLNLPFLLLFGWPCFVSVFHSFRFCSFIPGCMLCIDLAVWPFSEADKIQSRASLLCVGKVRTCVCQRADGRV